MTGATVPGPATAIPALRASAISVSLGGCPVLAEVSLEVRAGEVVALCGPNGAGKSTLLRALSGTLPLTAGQVECQGERLDALTATQRARRLAVVPQELVLAFPFTVSEVVLMGRAPYLGGLGIEGPGDLATVEEALRRADVLHLADRDYLTLSGGERQRVLIAKALAQATPILLFDEPTAHLDLRHQVLFGELVRQLASQGAAVLTAVHDLNLAVRLADRLALLRAGRLAGSGLPEELLTLDRLRAVFEADFHIGRAEDGHPFYLALGQVPVPSPGPRPPSSGPG